MQDYLRPVPEAEGVQVLGEPLSVPVRDVVWGDPMVGEEAYVNRTGFAGGG